MLHPNTRDPRAGHLPYALWVDRTQPVDAYDMQKPGPGEPPAEPVYLNTTPTMKPET